jgi:hypothetical protein
MHGFRGSFRSEAGFHISKGEGTAFLCDPSGPVYEFSYETHYRPEFCGRPYKKIAKPSRSVYDAQASKVSKREK